LLSLSCSVYLAARRGCPRSTLKTGGAPSAALRRLLGGQAISECVLADRDIGKLRWLSR
jgi:hypothetical protein